ncbi:hypothetical protein CVT25_007580 [Psilocybe cyanescens]|uniref:DJ-1/PfpI domain-containing protein n=1 Tax=Psilocybe cyanescens TaxID=93625 RepID=A0A409W3C0_PSICY|nr:hypothetical protein CVT25_007580 [Psilocybe cyanescens]
MSPQILNFGLILLPEFQWLDAAGPVDYINNHSYGIISEFRSLPQSLIDKAPIIKWHYISSDLRPVQPTSGPTQNPTCTFEDCPALDYIVVPGPDPTITAPKGFVPFIQKRIADPQLKALLMVCTAALIVAQAGVLDGLQVCSNKLALRFLSGKGFLNKFNKIKWVKDKRWTVDGKIWSSAGITSGIDLAAEFARVHFDAAIVELAKDGAEFEPKPAQPDPFARILEGVDL